MLYLFVNIHSELGDYRKADRVMEVLFKMRVAQLRKKKKNKSKAELRTSEKWRKEKAKVNRFHGSLDFQFLQ